MSSTVYPIGIKSQRVLNVKGDSRNDFHRSVIMEKDVILYPEY